jgi:hypothetical protein
MTPRPINCKGDDSKRHLVKGHTLLCILHIRLLEPSTLRCCCKKALKHEAYIFVRFSFAKKAGQAMFSDRDAKTIIAEKDCAVSFVRETNVTFPPPCKMFNNDASVELAYPAWDTLNLELYRAVQCLCSLSGHLPPASSQLGRFLAYIVRNPEKRTQDFAVIEVNKAVKSLLPRARSLRTDYASIMGEAALGRFDMQFPAMNAVLTANGQKINL